ncbi:DUF6783 domain-containing protein [Ruminococcus sp. 5_1_39BFAA]|uniref:DUF6783 domain-containing protein n=1 Tax=Ruminococcus sp. 5_1_39BFAA TaxID=457412 RepID=UPI00356840AE
MFAPHSVSVARYASLIWDKSPTNCEAHLAESNFQTRSRVHSAFATLRLPPRINFASSS